MIRKDETGAALPLTLAIIIVLTLLGFLMITFSTSETKQVALDENRMKAHYVARSGAHAVANHIINNRDDIQDLVDSGESEPVIFADGYYTVNVAVEPKDPANPDNSEEIIIVKSTGTVNGVTQKIDITIDNIGITSAIYANILEFAGAAGKSAEVSGGDIVFGGDPADFNADIATILVDGEVIFGYHPFKSVVLPCADEKSEFYGSCPTIPASKIDSRKYEISDDRLYTDIIIKHQEDPEYDLLIQAEKVDGKSKNIIVKADSLDIQNADFVVRLDDNVIALVVDEFTLKGEMRVELLEGATEGFLLFYVNNFNAGGNCNIIVSNGAHLNVYIFEREDLPPGNLDVSGTPSFHGSIYAPDAKTVIAGDAKIVGWIIANEVSGKGGVNVQFSPVQTTQTSMELDFYRFNMWRYAN